MTERITEKDMMGIQGSIMNLVEESDQLNREINQLSLEKDRIQGKIQEKQEQMGSDYESQPADMREELNILQTQPPTPKGKAKHAMRPRTPDYVHSRDMAETMENPNDIVTDIQTEKELENFFGSFGTGDQTIPSGSSDVESKITIEVTCEDGRILTEMPISGKDWNREMLLRHFYQKHMGSMQQKYEDSLARLSSCEQYKLAAKEDQKRMQEELDHLTREKDRLIESNAHYQDTLETTSSNYAAKIQQMSEHICELNERVKQLTEELTRYRSNLSSPTKSRMN
jgi:phage host-nuclease inhibitor protein Gam